MTPEEEQLWTKMADDFAAEIKAEKIKRVPRTTTDEMRDFILNRLITVHGIDSRLFGSGMGGAPTLT